MALTFVACERPQARGIHSAKDRLQCRAVGPVDEGARAAGVEVQKAIASPSAQPQALNIQPYCRTSVLPTKTLKRQTGAGKGLAKETKHAFEVMGGDNMAEGLLGLIKQSTRRSGAVRGGKAGSKKKTAQTLSAARAAAWSWLLKLLRGYKACSEACSTGRVSSSSSIAAAAVVVVVVGGRGRR